jgi:hypothetical protein
MAYSFTLKAVPKELFLKARGRAIAEGRTITAVIIRLLEAWLAGEVQV